MLSLRSGGKKKFERTVIAGLGDKLSMRLAGGSRNYERIVQKIVAAGSCKGNFGETGLVVGLFLGVCGVRRSDTLGDLFSCRTCLQPGPPSRPPPLLSWQLCLLVHTTETRRDM